MNNPESILNRFLTFCETLEKISGTQSRLEIQSILTDYYKAVMGHNKQDLIYALYLSTTTIYPEYKNKVLNLGDRIIMQVLSEATGMSTSSLRKEYKQTGDYGTIAMKNRASQIFISKRVLYLKDIVDCLREIADVTGPRATSLRTRKMLGLVAIASPLETKYLFRIFEEKLNVRLAFKTVLISLAMVFDKSYVDDVKSAYYRKPDIEALTNMIITNGIDKLSFMYGVEAGIPLKPMLAQPSKNISNGFKRVEGKNFTCEYKYDGERIQIHKNNGTITTYSRNLENTTKKYPDIVVGDDCACDFIIDCEVVAFDQKENKIMSFQTLSTRKRKDVKEITVNVCIFVFDILYFDGQSLIHKSLRERRNVLYRNFKEIENKFYFSKNIESSLVENIDAFFKEATDNGMEGVMVKLLDEGSNYTPCERSNSWIKLKKDYLDNVCDSFDLVVIGVYYGKGKRTGVYGGFLLACYNQEDDVFETVCKIGTGFSDNQLATFYELFNSEICGPRKEYRYKEEAVPDLWINPRYVWEVKAAGLSLSPVYCAGSEKYGKGISLRFPVFLRERCDKKPSDCTSSTQIKALYECAMVGDSENNDDDY